MPFNATRLAHIQANMLKIMAGRTQSVILTLQLPGGGSTTLTLNAIWRVMEDQDPVYDPAGVGGDDLKSADVVAMFNLADVSYDQMRSCVFAQLAPAQPGPDVATRFLPTAIFVKGIAPGGSRLIVTFDRQR